jgi:hypothetical protein
VSYLFLAFPRTKLTSRTTTTTKAPQAQAEAGPSKPAYQHRHRPDLPAAAAGALNEIKRPFVRAISSEDAAARRLSAIMGDAAPPAITPANNNVANPNLGHQSSGGSSSTSKAPVGGFIPQAVGGHLFPSETT